MPRSLAARRRIVAGLAGLLAAATGSAAAAAAPGGGEEPIAWAPGPEAALERARDEGKPLFVALHYEGEPRSEAFLEELYETDLVRRLAADCVAVVGSAATHAPEDRPCTRFEGIECQDHRDTLEWAAAELSLADVALPNHAWLDRDGNVLLSAPYELDLEELGWCFATALARARGEDEPELPPEARPPRRLVMRAVYRPARNSPWARGLTPVELEENRKRIVSSNRAGIGRRVAGFELLFADAPEAVDFARQELGRGLLVWHGNETLAGGIQLIGRISPPRFAELLEDWTDDRRDEIRGRAAIALEDMGAASAVKAVRSALRKEDDPHVRKNWIRALGATGYDDKRARKEVLKLAEREDDELLRANAIFATGYLLVDEDVVETLSEALASDSPRDRRAAACAMALSRRGLFVEPLRDALRSTEDATDRRVFMASLGVLRGAPLHTIEDHVTRVCGDRFPRERVFFKALDR